jgi:hypothetical protein
MKASHTSRSGFGSMLMQKSLKEGMRKNLIELNDKAEKAI